MKTILNITLAENAKLKKNEIDKIITLKRQYWKYCRESHITWLKDNLKKGDYHLLIKDNKHFLIAYLNIIKLQINIDGDIFNYWGIGNVCVNKKYSASGYGQLLMDILNFYLKKFNKPGILLCKKELIGFYKKAGWNYFKGQTFLNNKFFSKAVLLTEKIKAKTIKLNNNF